MTSYVPIAASLDDIYPDDVINGHSGQAARWMHLLAKFQEMYNRPADFVSRSPGRVNIIGEVMRLNSPNLEID